MTQTIQVSHDAFTNALERWAANNPEDAAFVTLDVPKTADFHLAVGGNAGVGITQDGELIALFNQNAPDGTGADLVRLAKERGATFLWCFETGLEDYYNQFGFSETERFPWDESKAPENWAYDKYGTPKLLKMEL